MTDSLGASGAAGRPPLLAGGAACWPARKVANFFWEAWDRLATIENRCNPSLWEFYQPPADHRFRPAAIGQWPARKTVLHFRIFHLMLGRSPALVRMSHKRQGPDGGRIPARA